jgi:hypothetical protein
MATLADIIGEKVRAAIVGALQDTKDELTEIAKAGGHEASGGLLGDVGTITGIIDNIAGPLLTLVGLAFPPVALLKGAESAGGKLGTGFGAGYYLGSAAFEALHPILLHLDHAIADAIQSEIFDPATVATLEAKGIVDNAYGRSEAAGGNLSGEHYDKLVESARTRPDVATLLEMLRRRIVDLPTFEATLARHGYAPEWQQRMLDLKELLLSPPDLALAALRGEMSETDAAAYASSLGVSEQDFATLIANTGEPPGTMEMLEAYRRGFIDEARLVRGIRQSRTRNEWIDVVEKLRLSPMSTADAVRAVVENYMSSDEGKVIAEQNGLEPAHWPFLVEAWGRPLSHGQMMDLYFRGQATVDEVKQAVRESDIKNKYVDKSVELGRRLLPEREIVRAIRFGALTPQDGARKLLELGYNQQDATILMTLGEHEATGAHKELSRAEIVSLYEEGLLHHADAISHLTGLGYSAQDATLTLTLADTKVHAKALRAETTHIRTLYVGGHIDQVQAKNDLLAIGLDSGNADRQIATWRRERGKATRGLSEAQIVHAATTNVLTFDQSLAALQTLGFTQQDATVILASHGVTSAQTHP